MAIDGSEQDQLEFKYLRMKESVKSLEIHMARQNVVNWGKYFRSGRFTVKSVPPFQRDLALSVESQQSFFCAGPRGMGKSQFISVTTPLYLACEHEKMNRNFIVIVSSAPDVCFNFVRLIRREIETNSKIRDEYGSLVGNPWKEGHLNLSNGMRIIAVPTLNEKIRGQLEDIGRPDTFILDDAETLRNVRTMENRKRVSEWYESDLIMAKDPGKDPMVLMAGTLLNEKSLLANKIRDNRGRIYKALVDGKSFWEERFSTESLLKMQLENPVWFGQEFMGVPASASLLGAYLKEIPISPYSRNDLSVFREVWIGVDLAKSLHSGADFTAFVMVGIKDTAKGEEMHVVDMWMERTTPKDHWDNLKEFWGGSKINGFIIESVAYQESFAYLVEEKLDELNLHRVEVGHFLPRNSKFDRLRDLVTTYSVGGEGRFFIVDHPLRETWIEQAIAIDEKKEHDDLADATTNIVGYREGGYLNIREAG